MSAPRRTREQVIADCFRTGQIQFEADVAPSDDIDTIDLGSECSPLPSRKRPERGRIVDAVVRDICAVLSLITVAVIIGAWLAGMI